jgi:Domain of unknown function (DUF397)
VARSLEDGPAKRMPVNAVIGANWRKSMRSIGNGQCAEAARLTDGLIAMRDSMDKSGPMLLFTQNEWRAFLKEIKDSAFGSI